MQSTGSRPDGRVVVVIVSYGRPQDVGNCLSGLAASVFDDIEVVIVENAGRTAFDGLVEHLAAELEAGRTGAARRALAEAGLAEGPSRRFYRANLRQGQPVLAVEAHTNLGYGGAVNLAIRCIKNQAGWRGLWILNPDTFPEPTALLHVVTHAEQGRYGLVGSRLVFAGQDRVQLRGGGEWHWLTGRAVNIGYGDRADAAAGGAEVERRLDWISGAALYATREYVSSVGEMNEAYFLYCEDVEWSLRRGRFRLGYAHNSIVRHAHGTTIGSSSQRSQRSNLSVYLSQRNTLLLTRNRAAHLYPIVAIVTLVLMLDLLVRGNTRVFRAGWRGWWAGICGRTGLPPAWVAAGNSSRTAARSQSEKRSV